MNRLPFPALRVRLTAHRQLSLSTPRRSAHSVGTRPEADRHTAVRGAPNALQPFLLMDIMDVQRQTAWTTCSNKGQRSGVTPHPLLQKQWVHYRRKEEIINPHMERWQEIRRKRRAIHEVGCWSFIYIYNYVYYNYTNIFIHIYNYIYNYVYKYIYI